MDNPLDVTWPIKDTDWKDKYALDRGKNIGYSSAYMNFLKDKYPKNEIFDIDNVTEKLDKKAKFDKNNYILNQLLLNAKDPKKPKNYLPKLQAKVDYFKNKIKVNKGIEKELVVSPHLLEAIALDLAKTKLAVATTMLNTKTVRNPEYLSELAPDILDQVRTHLTGTGKGKRKKTKKRGGKQVKRSSKSKQNSKKKRNKKHKSKTKSKPRK